MASSAPKRARTCAEETVFEGYLHDVTQMETSGKNTDYFNCNLQTSRDQYRRCVVYDAKKHGFYVKAAADRKPLKISNAGTILSNVNPGQLDIRIYYASTENMLKSLDFGYIEKPSIPNSVEEAQDPESARQRLEVEQQEVGQEEEEEVEQQEEEEVEYERITKVRGPVRGIQLADQRQCSNCRKGQLTFNIKAINHRCEACGLLQRVGSYVQAVNGTVMVNEGDGKLMLTLTLTVLMTYLSQNDLQELLADVQLVEEHFMEGGLFVILYNANNEVVVVTTGNV
ncbi:unnamed protein product [Arctogadus glacialis]